jgi:hypothetical protein
MGNPQFTWRFGRVELDSKSKMVLKPILDPNSNIINDVKIDGGLCHRIWLCEIKCNEFWYVIEKYCSSLRGKLSIVFKHVMLCRI